MKYSSSSRFVPCLAALVLCGLLLPSRGAITPGARPPSNEEQYVLQLINQARSSANGLTILQGIVSNNLAVIVASGTRDSQSGTPWTANFWTSAIPGVAANMNYFHVHPGDLKKQFMDLVIPNFPLGWNVNLGNVSSGYNDIIIASRGTSNGPGVVFPHFLAPYQDGSTFEAYAKRYTDGGYGPLDDINALGENIAPNNFSNALSRFAAFMIDWGSAPDGIQDQDPATGSHRLSIMANDFNEIGISIKPGWDADNTTEDQEFGRRFSTHVVLTGAVYRDLDSNGFYTAGEGSSGVTVTATPVGGGAAKQTATSGSGGYSLELNTPGTYNVTMSGTFGVINAGDVAINTKNVWLNKVVGTGSVAADFNGDGRADFLLFNQAGFQMVAWFMNGVQVSGWASGLIAPVGWSVVGSGDFNADGRTDLVLYNAANHQTLIWFLNGFTRIGSTPGPTIPVGWSIRVGDLNGDGKPDYLLYNDAGHQTVAWYMSGARITGWLSGPTFPPGWSIRVADFNKDGRADYFIFNNATRQTAVWTLNGAAVTSYATGPTLPIGASVVGVGDFNGDKKPDYLVYSATSQQTSIWFNGSTSWSPAPAIPAGWIPVLP